MPLDVLKSCKHLGVNPPQPHASSSPSADTYLIPLPNWVSSSPGLVEQRGSAHESEGLGMPEDAVPLLSGVPHGSRLLGASKVRPASPGGGDGWEKLSV